MRRRLKGEGTVTQRSDGRWQAAYVGSDSKRHYLYATSRKEVSQKLSAALRDKELGVYVAGPSQTLDLFLETWLADASSRLKPRTVQRYESLFRIHVTPRIGAVQVRKVGPQHLVDLYAAMRDAAAAPASIAQVHAVLGSAFKQAVMWGLMARNPRDAVRPPRPQRREMVVLSPEQSRQIIEATRGTEMGTLYLMAMHTGMRLGELLALRWRDVTGDQINVNATLVRIGGQTHRASPKSAAGVRTIAMSPTLREAVARHRPMQAERLLKIGVRIDDDSLVFTDRWGNPQNGFHITERDFKPLLRRLGLPEVRFHDLRHAFASLMLSQGTRVDLVSRMLGHAKPATTLNIYAHLLPGDQEEAIRRLELVLGG
jgi:integrase